MAESSHIQWTDATWNPVVGCRKVSPECDNCYAMHASRRIVAQMKGAMDKRKGGGTRAQKAAAELYAGVLRKGADGALKPAWNGLAVTVADRLEIPARWRKPRRIFVNSMSDLFHADVPYEFIAAVFGVMAVAHHHIYQILTKRPRRAERWFAWLLREAAARPQAADGTPPEVALCLDALQTYSGAAWPTEAPGATWPLANVALGVSGGTQRDADERLAVLRDVPSALRWLSAEPLLGAVVLESHLPHLDWVVVGGESGRHARKCNVEWIEAINAECRAHDVPCFNKQLGRYPYEGAEQRDCYSLRRCGMVDCADGCVFGLAYHVRHPHGADTDEWPDHLKVRELPPMMRMGAASAGADESKAC